VGIYTPGSNIAAAETPPDSSTFLDIDQYRYAHFSVDDIDAAQAVEGMMEIYMQGCSEELATVRDSYIASRAATARADMLSESAAITTAAAAKTAIDTGLKLLMENGVRLGQTQVSIVLTPWMYMLFQDYLITASTNNVELLKKGIVGMYNGAVVKYSNNLYNDNTDDYMMIRTKNAIAFASGISKTEALREPLQFADTVKVLDCFAAKLVRPEEMYVIRARAS
jgi:hypothetical protein